MVVIPSGHYKGAEVSTGLLPCSPGDIRQPVGILRTDSQGLALNHG